MANPILEQMGMGRQNNILSIMDLIRGKSPRDAVAAMCDSNPSFRAFYEKNKDKPIDDVCREYNINPLVLRQLMGK